MINNVAKKRFLHRKINKYKWCRTLNKCVSNTPSSSWLWVIKQYFDVLITSFGLVMLVTDFLFFKTGCSTVLSGANIAGLCSNHWSCVLQRLFPYLGLLTAIVFTVLGLKRWKTSICQLQRPVVFTSNEQFSKSSIAFQV